MKTLLPGQTIGIIGGGQLARMMILEGKKMGYRFVVVDPAKDCASASVADELIVGKWSSLNAAIALASKADVVTVDTEHVPWQSMQSVEEHTLAFPSSIVLKNIQDRLLQREFLARNNIAQTTYQNVETLDELHQAVSDIGYPCVLKTRTSGYDGKGQVIIKENDDVLYAWEHIGRLPCILEAFVDFQAEISIVLARTKIDQKAHIATYPAITNEHRRHILHRSVMPSQFDEKIIGRATVLAHQVVNAFDYIGVMAIELFVTKTGDVLVNEIAPRTHNSGHVTYGGCKTSQFEQHIRAITFQALGSTRLIQPTVLTNLMGELWEEDIRLEPILQCPQAALHIYDKHPPRHGRKMGHFLVCDEDLEMAVELSDSLFREVT